MNGSAPFFALLLILSALCLCGCASAAGSRAWRKCSEDDFFPSFFQSAKLNVESINVTPQSLLFRKGQMLDVDFVGKITQGTVREGALSTSVIRNGRELFTFKHNLCDDRRCPASEGQIVKGTIRERVPSRAFTGAYTVRSVVSLNQKEVECVEFDITVTN
jgi:hypothetical protein